jgi:signal transduction histidine kinase
MQKEKQGIIVAILTVSMFVFLFGVITFLLAVKYARRKRKLLIEKEMQEFFSRQSVMKAELEMQDHTFRLVSQDIHDNVGQLLSLIKLNLNILAFDQMQNQTFHNLKELVSTAIVELRDLGAGYYAERLAEKGLLPAIKHQLRHLEHTGMFTTSFYSDMDDVPIDKNKIIFLYRMVQEVLNNVMKHSGANHVKVAIFKNEASVHVIIEDNGRGFKQTAADFTPGIGLSSIRQRACMIDTEVYVNSELGSGTVVTIVFKIE